MKKLGWKWPKVPFLGQKRAKMPQFDIFWTVCGRGLVDPSNWPENPRFYCDLWNIYPSNQRKYPFWPKGAICPNSVSSKPFVIEGWLTPENDHRPYVSIVFRIIYIHQTTGSDLFRPKWAKCPNSISSEPFVVESWLNSQNDRRPQVSIVFHIIYAHQTARSICWVHGWKDSMSFVFMAKAWIIHLVPVLANWKYLLVLCMCGLINLFWTKKLTKEFTTTDKLCTHRCCWWFLLFLSWLGISAFCSRLPYEEKLDLNPGNYGYVLDDDDDIIPLLTNDSVNGQYSGQKCLLMPLPLFFWEAYFCPVFAAFYIISWCSDDRAAQFFLWT